MPVPEDAPTPWWPWALLALVIAGVAGWFGFLAAKRRRWDAQFATDLSEARWVADSLVPSVADRALPPEQVSQHWLDGKRRLDDLQSDLYRLGSTVPNTERATRLGQVSGALGALQESLQSDVTLRTATPPAPGTTTPLDAAAAADASFQQVSHRRDELIAAIEDRPVGPAHTHLAP